MRVTEQAPGACSHTESDSLHPCRRKGRPNRVEVRIRNHRSPEQPRLCAPARLAPNREREHRLKQRIEPQCRPQLADDVRDILTSVPESVPGPRRNGDAPARPDRPALTAHPYADRPMENINPFLLPRMDVRREAAAVRRHEHLKDDGPTVGVIRRAAEDDTHTRDRVLDDLL